MALKKRPRQWILLGGIRLDETLQSSFDSEVGY